MSEGFRYRSMRTYESFLGLREDLSSCLLGKTIKVNPDYRYKPYGDENSKKCQYYKVSPFRSVRDE